MGGEHMSDQEILQKAIKKAFPDGATGKTGALIMTLYEFKQDKFQRFALERAIIFSHDFAKAFWGEEDTCRICGSIEERDYEGRPTIFDYSMCDCNDGLCSHGEYPIKCLVCDMDDEDDLIIPSYKYHLQQIVLEEHPIQYLEKYL